MNDNCKKLLSLLNDAVHLDLYASLRSRYNTNILEDEQKEEIDRIMRNAASAFFTAKALYLADRVHYDKNFMALVPQDLDRKTFEAFVLTIENEMNLEIEKLLTEE